jgi:hypothetical protein
MPEPTENTQGEGSPTLIGREDSQIGTWESLFLGNADASSVCYGCTFCSSVGDDRPGSLLSLFRMPEVAFQGVVSLLD